MPAAEAKPIRLISNGVNLYGDNYYAHLETLNSEYAQNQFPLDSNGNLYKGRRSNESPPGGRGAGLAYHVDVDGNVDVAGFLSYTKLTNAGEADYADVIELTRILNNEPDETYLQATSQVANIDQWLRFFALNALIGNTEGGLMNGDRQGDDYAMYRGVDDPRFVMIPHDLDSILSNRNWPLTRATGVPALNRLLFHPDIKPRYFDTIRKMVDELVSEPTDLAIERSLRVFGEAQINRAKDYLRARRDIVLAEINRAPRIDSVYPMQGELTISQTPTAELHGITSQESGSVRVNGRPISFSNSSAQWQYGSHIATLVSTGSNWRFLDDGSNQGTAWREPEFAVDDSWKEGRGEFGYGDSDERTVVDFGDDPENKHITTYFRHEFQVPDPAGYREPLVMTLKRDDGIAVYLNGTEVIRSNLPEDAGFDTVAIEEITGSAERVWHAFTIDSSLLVEGKNVLAAEVHQRRAASEDISFYSFLQGRYVTPGAGVPLNPGINRVSVESMTGPNGTGDVLSSTEIDIWYDDGDMAEFSGTLNSDTTWTASGGPYFVAADLTVPADVRLTIEPGTSVYFAQDAELIINGTLVARGSEHQRIRFTSNPTAEHVPDLQGLPIGPPRWDGIHFKNSSSPLNSIAYADIEYAQDLEGAIGVIDSTAAIDNVSFKGTHLRMVFGSNASMVVQDSVFPDMFAENEDPAVIGLDNVAEHIKIVGRTPVDGVLLIRGNHFGTNKGHNDVIDADSNRRVNGPILQVLNNTFTGAGDELLDLGGDVYVAGNVFTNVFKDDPTSDRGYANAISTGDAGANTTIVVARNLFYDVDHAINLRNNAATIFENNTVVKVHRDFDDRFGNPNVGSVVNLFVDEPGATPALGAHVAGNILVDIPRVFGNADLPDNRRSVLSANDNLIVADEYSIADRPASLLSIGPNNFIGDPRFRNANPLDFSLLPGSDAIDTETGHDLGWLIEDGIRISGEPESITSDRRATLTVGGPGIFSYSYRINGGPWSDEFDIGTGFDVNGTVRTAAIRLANLADGEYQVEVRGRDFAGNLQAIPTVSKTWTVKTGQPQLLINEVLADNRGAFVSSGRVPDAIELFNAGDTAINLKGYGISDRLDQPEKFVFNDDTIIQPGEYLVLLADGESKLPGIHLGFGLDRNGEAVYLFSKAGDPDDRPVVDFIEFGNQVGNFSIGRVGQDRQWNLAIPTIGRANERAKTGDPSRVLINEWYSAGDIEDFVELYNEDTLPVGIGGYFITDELAGAPELHKIAPLSFIAARDFAVFTADQSISAGPDHLNFGLAQDQEIIALSDPSGNLVDAILYATMGANVSEGRMPDGAVAIASFDVPSPGRPNGTGLPGDFDDNEIVEVEDIELLCSGIRLSPEDLQFDLTRDGVVNHADLAYFLTGILNTSAGDSNLDGIFDSSDLVAVFIPGEYEDGIDGNSTWREGDWNCDGDFGTADLVAAFRAGRYSQFAVAAPHVDQHIAEFAAARNGQDQIDFRPAANDGEKRKDSLRLIRKRKNVQPVNGRIVHETLFADPHEVRKLVSAD